MSTFQAYDPRLLQGGMLSGFQLAQNADQDRQTLLLRQQAQALDEAQFAERVRLAREEAQRNLDQKQADAEFYRSLTATQPMQAVAGPRPGQPAMTGEPASFTNTLGGSPDANQAAPVPAAMPMPTDPLHGLNPSLLTRISPHAQSVLGRLVEDRAKTMQERADAAQHIQYMRGVRGMLKTVDPLQWKKWEAIVPDITNQIPNDEVPPDIRRERELDHEQARIDQIYAMATTPDGSIDFMRFNALNSLGSADLSNEYRKHLASQMVQDRQMAIEAQKAAAKQTENQAIIEQGAQDLAAERKIPIEEARRKARLVKGNFVNEMQGFTEKYVTQRASAMVSDAEDDYKRAVALVNELADMKEDPSGQTAKKGVSAAALSQARAGVLNAERRIVQARTERDRMLSGGDQAPQRDQMNHVNATYPTQGDGFDESGYVQALQSGTFAADVQAMSAQGLSAEEIDQRLRQMHSQNRAR